VSLDLNDLEFARKLAAALGPLGVKRVKLGELELEFHEPAPAPLSSEPAKSTPEDEQARQMDTESSTDPLDDPATFNGRAPPSYGSARRPKKQKPEWPELDTEGQE